MPEPTEVTGKADGNDCKIEISKEGKDSVKIKITTSQKGKGAKKPEPETRTWETATYLSNDEDPSVAGKGYGKNTVTRIYNNKGTSMLEIHCPDHKDKKTLPWVQIGDGITSSHITLKDHKDQDKLVEAVKGLKLPQKKP